MSKVQKIPYFDRRRTYSAEYFENSIIQTYLALFLSKPELYERVHLQSETLKQDEFFRAFNKFLAKYYTYKIDTDFDLYTYFGTLHMEKKGERNVCGGSGIKSKSSNKCFMDKHKALSELIEKSVEYLNQKYKIEINSEKDNRTFLGHTEIWKNPSPALLVKMGYTWVSERSYDDETLQMKLPEELDINLIPLSVRNKVYQKWKNQKNQKNAKLMKSIQLTSQEEEEDEATVSVSVSSDEDKNEKEEKTIVISDDLQAMLEEEW
jgi:hypothetical protein